MFLTSAFCHVAHGMWMTMSSTSPFAWLNGSQACTPQSGVPRKEKQPIPILAPETQGGIFVFDLPTLSNRDCEMKTEHTF